MSDISRKKELIRKAYPHSKTWPAKVARMPDNQVIAVYNKFVEGGKIRT